MDEIEPQTAITSVPMPTTLSLVPAASSPIGFPAPGTDFDFGAAITATGTSTGTTAIALSNVKPNSVVIGSLVSGTGVPANTRLSGQTSGPPGGAGNYTTNNATTLAGVSLTLTPSRVISPGGNTLPIVVNPATVIPGEPREKINAGHDYVLALPTFANFPLAVGTTFNQSVVPPFLNTFPPANNAHPLPASLAFNRNPAFPAYP